ncbi:hypothetical protein KCP69_19900 [Salmonella enterica subsp. enterica]|nr:hypothetical protein KCP69_19900 [Salmonella enterica subsp. enterica]
MNASRSAVIPRGRKRMVNDSSPCFPICTALIATRAGCSSFGPRRICSGYVGVTPKSSTGTSTRRRITMRAGPAIRPGRTRV